MNKTFGTYQDYMALLAIRHKKLLYDNQDHKSFFRCSEALVNATFALVKLEGFTGSIIKESVVQINTGVYFLKHVSGTGTQLTDRIEAAQEESFKVMMDFWTRIQKESDDGKYLDANNQPACSFVETLLPPVFEAISEPYADNFYGWRMTLRFTISTPDYEPENWN